MKIFALKFCVHLSLGKECSSSSPSVAHADYTFFSSIKSKQITVALPEMQGSSLFCVPEDFFLAPRKTQQTLMS